MFLIPEDLLKLGLAVMAGGLIGIEREYRDKAAGVRTLIFICLGAALFTILSSRLAGDNDPTRIAAGIVAGVGFSVRGSSCARGAGWSDSQRRQRSGTQQPSADDEMYEPRA